MKRILSCFMVFSVMSLSTAIAQTTSIGPIIGVNSSTVINLPNNAYKAGLTVGGFLNHSVDEHFGINGKLLFSQLGTGFDNSSLVHRLNYIQLPVSGVYYFGDAGNRFRPKVFLGLYVGSLLNATYDNGDDIKVNGADGYKKFDFGGQVGLGFNYRLKSRTWLNVDAGYNAGFVELSDNLGSDLKNRAFNLNVGVSFPVSAD